MQAARERILKGDEAPFDAGSVAVELSSLVRPSLRRVINATGVVLHTNLGRAPLSARAVDRVTQIARGYCNLELDLDEGERGSRYSHVVELICRMTGAEDALVVNNCAAATLLTLGALAQGREVIVSRGELVEIGGGFRVPDVMRQSGCALVEVGTTNRTRVGDYEAALTSQTGLLLKVHRSNFAVVGFTEEASTAELAELGRSHGVRSVRRPRQRCVDFAPRRGAQPRSRPFDRSSKPALTSWPSLATNCSAARRRASSAARRT